MKGQEYVFLKIKHFLRPYMRYIMYGQMLQVRVPIRLRRIVVSEGSSARTDRDSSWKASSVSYPNHRIGNSSVVEKMENTPP